MWMLSWRSFESSSIATDHTPARFLTCRLERPKDVSHGDFATNVALRTAKEVRRPPRELAEELAARIGEVELVESTEVAGPGFINLRLTDPFFVEALGEVGEAYGGGWAAGAP